MSDEATQLLRELVTLRMTVMPAEEWLPQMQALWTRAEAFLAAEQATVPPREDLLSRYDDEPALSARETLACLMSEISEECYCAGWLIGNEHRLWSAMTDPTDDRRYGMGEISQEQIERLRMLSAMCGGWCAWDDKAGCVFVPMDKWRARIAAIEGKRP